MNDLVPNFKAILINQNNCIDKNQIKTKNLENLK